MASLALALAVFQDTTDSTTSASNMATGMGIVGGLFVALVVLVFFALFLFLFWRILIKAGFSGWLTLLNFVPCGTLIILCILAFGQWKVIPAPIAAPSYPPPPPPPPSFPQQ